MIKYIKLRVYFYLLYVNVLTFLVIIIYLRARFKSGERTSECSSILLGHLFVGQVLHIHRASSI